MLVSPLWNSLPLNEAHAASGGLMETLIHANVINVVIVLVGIAFLLNKIGILSLLDKQRSSIEKQLVDAKSQRDEAEKALNEAQQRLTNLNHEIEGILAEARQTAEQMAKSVIDAANNDAKALMKQTQRRLSLEAMNTSRSLEQQLLLDAINDAQARLTHDMSVEERLRSIETFIDTLPEAVAAYGDQA